MDRPLHVCMLASILVASVLVSAARADGIPAKQVKHTPAMLAEQLARFTATRDSQYLHEAAESAAHLITTAQERHGQSSRDYKLHALLNVVERGRAAIDPQFDPKERVSIHPPMPRLPEHPTGPTFYFSGMSPEAIADPVIRKEFEEATVKHKEHVAWFTKEYRLWEEAALTNGAVRLLIRREYQGDEKAAYRIIDAEVRDPELRKALKRAE